MPQLVPVYSPYDDTMNNIWNSLAGNYSNPLKAMTNTSTKPIALINNDQFKATNIRVYIQFKTGNTIATNGGVELWIAGSPDGLTCSDGYTYTQFTTVPCPNINTPSNSIFIKKIMTPTTSTVYVWEDDLLNYMASIPKYCGIIIVNNSGGSLDATYTHKIGCTYITFDYV